VPATRWKCSRNPATEPLDGEWSGLEQHLRPADTRLEQPLQRSGASLLLEVSAQGANAHRRSSRDVLEGDVLIEVLFQPLQDVVQ
jgi:hypothetical protein